LTATKKLVEQNNRGKQNTNMQQIILSKKKMQQIMTSAFRDTG